MKKLLPLLLCLVLSSCETLKITNASEIADDIHQVIIKDKWSPIDFHELKVYPIKDTKSWAIGVIELGTNKLIYARDKYGEIYEQYNIGDTIPVKLLGITNN